MQFFLGAYGRLTFTGRSRRQGENHTNTQLSHLLQSFFFLFAVSAAWWTRFHNLYFIVFRNSRLTDARQLWPTQLVSSLLFFLGGDLSGSADDLLIWFLFPLALTSSVLFISLAPILSSLWTHCWDYLSRSRVPFSLSLHLILSFLLTPPPTTTELRIFIDLVTLLYRETEWNH